MQAGASLFIHILAFQCPQCEKPVVEWMLSPMRSPESIDACTFNLKCSCGWSDGWLGAQGPQASGRVHGPPPTRRLPILRSPSALNRRLTGKKKAEEDTLNTLWPGGTFFIYGCLLQLHHRREIRKLAFGYWWPMTMKPCGPACA